MRGFPLTESVEQTVLPSGAIVLTETLSHVASASVGVWIAAGSRHETGDEAGLTHFLEHLLFKGTPRRTARRIAEELDAVGGSLDAGTGREHMALTARVLAEHVPLACDIMCDMIRNALLRDEDVRREREVVLDEIRAYEDEPGDVVMERLMAALYGDHPIARPVLGRREVLEGATAAAVRAFRGRYFAAGRLVVAAAGRVEHARVVELMRPLLEGLPPGGRPEAGRPPEGSPQVRADAREQEQVHLALAAPALPYAHPDRFALAVLNNVLGGTASSRLFQEVREERGLAYSVGSWVEAAADSGALVIHTATDPAKFVETAGVVGSVLEGLAREGPTDAEAARARDQLKGSLLLGLESPAGRMSRLATARLYFPEVMPIAEVVRRVEGVTADDVRKLARELLDPPRFAAAVLGPGDAGRYRLPWAPPASLAGAARG